MCFIWLIVKKESVDCPCFVTILRCSNVFIVIVILYCHKPEPCFHSISWYQLFVLKGKLCWICIHLMRLERDCFMKKGMVKNMPDISWPVVPGMCQVLKLLNSSLNPPSSTDDTVQVFSWDDYYSPRWVNWWSAPLNNLCHLKHLASGQNNASLKRL